MTLQNKHHLLARLDRLIRRKAAGDAEQLAEKLELSPSTIYEYLRYMRELGAPICFCRWRRSYYYAGKGKFFIGFLPEDEAGS